MLPLPTGSEFLRILAIDPGSSCTGIACFIWDFESPTVTLDSAFTLKFSNRSAQYAGIRDIGNDKLGRLQQLEDELEDVVAEFQPHLVICESNYMGSFADAFATLVECVATIRNVIYRFNPTLPLITVDPITAKKAAGIKGRSNDKTDVTNALKKSTDVIWNVELESLDEHATDAVAIGVYLFQMLRNRS